MSFESFINYISFEKRMSKHTISAYETDLGQFQAYLKDSYEIDFLKVDSAVIRSWMAYLLKEGVSERSVNRKITTIRSFYKYLLKNNKVSVNPVGLITTLKTPKRLPTYIRQDEIDRLLAGDFFESSFKGLRDKLIIFFLFSTGIRLGELINIQKNDIIGDSVKVLGKRNKERVIPLTRSLNNLINEYLKYYTSEFRDLNSYLLVTDKGVKLYEKFVFRKVKYYLGQVTTQTKLSPHVLRHTFATQMLRNGADLNAIKELLGHSDLSATQIYTHNSVEELKKVYKQAHPRSGG